MWLEDRPQPPIADVLSRRRQGGAHLGWVVPVVVVHDDAGSIGDQLHASPRPGEAAQAVDKRSERRTKGPSQDQCRGRVQDVVLPRQGRLEVEVEQRETGATAFEPDVGGLDLTAWAVAQDAPGPIVEPIEQRVGA